MAGIAASIADTCPNAELTVLSADPVATHNEHGIRAVQRMNPCEVIAALRSADLLISGGGSLLQDVTSARSIFYYLGVIWLAKKLDKRVMVYAQGIGPLNGRYSRAATKSVMNRVDSITVRDTCSMELLQELGIGEDRITLTADPSFALQPAPRDEIADALKASQVPEGVPLIGVSLRPWRDHIDWLPTISQGLDAVATQVGAALVFLPMQRDQDTSICVQMASRMTVPSYVVTTPLSPRKMMTLIGEMSLLIGMRLHALIFAASSGVPFVSLAYDPKVEAFTRICKQGESLRLNALTSTEISARVMDAWTRREELSEIERAQVQPLRDAARENAARACELAGC